MKNKARLLSILGGSILVFAFGFSLVRASVQSISHDEALTYLWFLQGGPTNLLHYDANNHILFTFLAKPFVKLLGPSELTLRAASLLGAAFYLSFAFLLSRRLFGESFLFVACAAVLALNPLVMDFESAARGYGLGLAFLLGAMHFLAGCVPRGTFDPVAPEWRRDCATASVLLGLSFAANFTNVISAASLLAAFAVSVLPLAAMRASGNRNLLRGFVLWAVSPGVVVAAFPTWPYLIQARPRNFYLGYPRAADSVRDLFNATFLYRWTDDVLSSRVLSARGLLPFPPGSWQEHVSDLGTYVFLPLLALVLLGGAIYSRADASPREQAASELRRFFCRAFVICVALILALHFAVNLKYPLSRTCLYLVPLGTVSILLLAREVSTRFPGGVLRTGGVLAAILLIADFAACLQMRTIRYQAYDARSREAFLSILHHGQSRGLTSARFGGTWWFEPEMGFYRRRYRAAWLLPYDIKDRSFEVQTENSLEPADYDYFLYLPENEPDMSGRTVRTIFHDDKTQLTIIAISRQ